MARLPTPGQDNGTWGDILNEFLGVEHHADGTLKETGSLAAKLTASSNLSDISSTSTARTNLGLGNAATRNVGTTSTTVAAGDEPLAVHKTLFDARGDILVATAADTADRLPVGANGKVLVADSTQPAGVAYSIAREGSWGPADHGLIAWTIEPANATSTLTRTSGASTVSALRIPYATTVTNILTLLTAGGTGLTPGQSFAALYDGNNQLLATTADQSTAWTSSGLKTMPLTTPQAVQPGMHKILSWTVFSGSSPTFARANPGSTTLTNFNLSDSNYRASVADSGLTTTAPSTIGPQTAGTSILLFAVS